VSDQLDKLIAGLFDDSLSSADQLRLAELLTTSPEALARCALACQLEGDLVRLVKTGQLDLLQTQPRLAPRPGAVPRRPLPRWAGVGGWMRIAAVVAILAVPAAWMILERGPAAPVALRLTVHAGTVGIGAESVSGERDLANGVALSVSPSGRATLRCGDGTIMELDGGTTLRVSDDQDGKRVLLEHGDLRASVSKQPVGFPLRMSTLRCEVTVVGTRLALSTGLVADHLEVTEGRVRCQRRADHQEVDVAAGYAVEIAAGTALAVHRMRTPAPLPPGPGLVVWYDSTQGVELSPDGRVARWRDRSASGQDLVVPKGANGPHLVADGSEARAVVRFAAHKEILAVRGKGPSGPAFTVAVLLRANELGQLSQGFGWGWGMFDFHSDARGGIHAGTGTATVGRPDAFNRFVNGHDQLPPAIIQVGRWQRIMISCADGAGAFYMDGQLIGRKMMAGAPIAGVLCIGRGDAPVEQPYSFSGDLAELLVYDRALDAQERELIDRRLQDRMGP
jgi:hypothetical protein